MLLLTSTLEGQLHNILVGSRLQTSSILRKLVCVKDKSEKRFVDQTKLQSKKVWLRIRPTVFHSIQGLKIFHVPLDRPLKLQYAY